MTLATSRRRFLARAGTLGALAFAFSPRRLAGADAPAAATPAALPDLGFPLVDYHVHLDNSTIEKVAELSRQRGVKFGIVEHAGTKENKYPKVLSDDAELKEYLAMLEGHGVYRGVQAEWTDWMGCFSPGALAQLDYVLSDAMTFPGKDGRRQKLWEPGYDIDDKQAFMDRFVEWHVEIMAREPLDILANVSWLPAALAPDYETYWTPPRVQKVVEAAVKHQVALEISGSYKLPRLSFLRLAKAAGVKFSFGSNGRYPNMGKLEYSCQMARELGLKASDMFTPAPEGRKAVQRRR